MRAIVTVIGKDRVGITASVCSLLAENQINILDITQTVLEEYFTMIMLVETKESTASFKELSAMLEALGTERGLSIHIQHEDLFQSMHRI